MNSILITHKNTFGNNNQTSDYYDRIINKFKNSRLDSTKKRGKSFTRKLNSDNSFNINMNKKISKIENYISSENPKIISNSKIKFLNNLNKTKRILLDSNDITLTKNKLQKNNTNSRLKSTKNNIYKKYREKFFPPLDSNVSESINNKDINNKYINDKIPIKYFNKSYSLNNYCNLANNYNEITSRNEFIKENYNKVFGENDLFFTERGKRIVNLKDFKQKKIMNTISKLKSNGINHKKNSYINNDFPTKPKPKILNLNNVWNNPNKVIKNDGLANNLELSSPLKKFKQYKNKYLNFDLLKEIISMKNEYRKEIIKQSSNNVLFNDINRKKDLPNKLLINLNTIRSEIKGNYGNCLAQNGLSNENRSILFKESEMADIYGKTFDKKQSFYHQYLNFYLK